MSFEVVNGIVEHGLAAQTISTAEAQFFDIVEPHHHFIDTSNHFQQFLKSLGTRSYSAEDFERDIIKSGHRIGPTIHVEAMPDDDVAEVMWVETMISEKRCSRVGGIVAQCDLSSPEAGARLDALLAASPLRLRGVRCILDFDLSSSSDSDNGTHVACSMRHDKDFLRHPAAAADFERGFALLADRGLSFDLQCTPNQLPAAAAMLSRHGNVPVCLDHIGKPRYLLLHNADGDYALSAVDSAKVEQWREGMALLSVLPQVRVKLSMLGYAVPGWHRDKGKEAFLENLVLETIELFGAHRCMFSSNYHVSPGVSDSDGLLANDDGPSLAQLYTSFRQWTSHLSAEERARLFSGTAAEFYRL